jgi:hypothetical protein
VPGQVIKAHAASTAVQRGEVLRHVLPRDGEQVRLVHAKRRREPQQLRLVRCRTAEHLPEPGFRDAYLPGKLGNAQPAPFHQPP